MSNSLLQSSESMLDNDITSLMSPSQGASSGRSNALSNKLNSVLSRSYADPEIKDALSILEHQGFVNNASARSRLRLDAQKEVIDSNGAIVQDFGQVAQSLKRIGTMIGTLNKTCDDMRDQIETAQKETAPMLGEASALTTQKNEVETKQQLVRAFNKHFIISDDELMLATSSTEPVNDGFFQVMHRLKQLRKDCEALVGAENQTLGLELMEQTSYNLNAAFKKLYGWVQREFKVLDLEDPQISGSIRKALRVLAERPTLFENSLQFFAEARDQTLSNAFHVALTEAVDGDTATSRSANPIDLQTHDLLRYLGDMLAWVHSATVSEKEALEALFITDGDVIARGIKQGRDNEPWSRLQRDDGEIDDDDVPAFDGAKALKDLVNRDLDGVGHVLKQRVEIAVHSTEEPLLVYRALNLLGFYKGVFGKLLGAPSSLQNIIVDLETSNWSHFERLTQDQTSAIANETVPDDLSPPLFLTNALDQFRSIVSANPDLSEHEISRLLSTALVPFLDRCSQMAHNTSSPSDATSRSIFELNCLLAVDSSLNPILPTNHNFLTAAQTKTNDLREVLVSSQHMFLLDRSGVAQLHDAAVHALNEDDKKNNTNSNSITRAFHPDSLSSLAATLDDFLPTAQMDMLDNLGRVVDKGFAKDVTREAAERFCGDFELVESAIGKADEVGFVRRRSGREEPEQEQEEEKEGGGDDDDDEETDEEDEDEDAEKMSLRQIYPRTTAEIRLLLS